MQYQIEIQCDGTKLISTTAKGPIDVVAIVASHLSTDADRVRDQKFLARHIPERLREDGFCEIESASGSVVAFITPV